jgi:membrane associated rhomboid family serine protease
MEQGGFMPQVLEDVTAHASKYANPRREETMSPPSKEVVNVSTVQKEDSQSRWPMILLTTGGSATGAAFLGGAFAGPAGAVGGTVVGIVLGLYLHRFKK